MVLIRLPSDTPAWVNTWQQYRDWQWARYAAAHPPPERQLEENRWAHYKKMAEEAKLASLRTLTSARPDTAFFKGKTALTTNEWHTLYDNVEVQQRKVHKQQQGAEERAKAGASLRESPRKRKMVSYEDAPEDEGDAPPKQTDAERLQEKRARASDTQRAKLASRKMENRDAAQAARDDALERRIALSESVLGHRNLYDLACDSHRCLYCGNGRYRCGHPKEMGYLLPWGKNLQKLLTAYKQHGKDVALREMMKLDNAGSRAVKKLVESGAPYCDADITAAYKAAHAKELQRVEQEKQNAIRKQEQEAWNSDEKRLTREQRVKRCEEAWKQLLQKEEVEWAAGQAAAAGASSPLAK